MSSVVQGQKAPDFKVKDQNGKERSLAEFKGKKLVLYFYPKDNTPGCTEEACDIRDNYNKFLAKGYAVLGISPDSERKHKNFIAKFQLPFDLLADTDHAITELYGLWVEKMMWGRKYMGVARTTYIIDEKGYVEQVISKVDTKNHSAQIL